MKSLSVKFLSAVGVLVILFTGVFYLWTWSSCRRLLTQSAEREVKLALEFDLAIREYVGETIRPEFEAHCQPDEFYPETMSTSFVARSIFEKVREKYPECIIRFASDNPRNPLNLAGPEELEILKYFRTHPEATEWTGQIEMNGKPYYAVFSPRRATESCLQCHGNPEDAPKSLVDRYGDVAGFHRSADDVISLDTVGIPMAALHEEIASQTYRQLLVAIGLLVLLFGVVFLLFRGLIGRRLQAIARHFQQTAEESENALIAAIPVQGRDEIGLLVSRFNQLADKWNALRRHWEERVEQRTEELEAEVTQRRRIERELRDSREFLQGVIDAIPKMIFVTDIQYRVVMMNRIAREHFGGDFLGTEIQQYELHDDCHTPCNGITLFESLQKAVHNQAPVTVTHSHVDETGNRSYVEILAAPIFDVRNNVVQVVATCRDITELAKTQEELAQSEAIFQVMASAARDMIIMINQQGSIYFWNPAATETFGYREKEVLGRNLHELICRPAELARHREKFSHFQKTGQGAAVGKTLELIGKSKDGSEIPVELSLAAVQRGECWHAIGILRDVSERKQAEAALKQKEEQLRQAQKMEAIGLLAGGISHEFNNLLQIIQGYTGFAVEAISPEDPSYHDLQQVLSAADKAASLTRQLLDFSRCDALCEETIDPNRLIRDLLRMIRPLIGENIEIVTRLGETGRALRGDANMLAQIMVNLCINARDAMPDGGRLEIRTELVHLTREQTEHELNIAPGEYLTLSIRDTGTGIPDDIIEHIFEPFFTTKEVGKGTGLGLAVAYSVIQQHQGTLRVESRVGEGTTLSIYLPAIQAELPTENTPSPLGSVIGGTETVLLAEDDELVRTIVARFLNDAGYTVLSAENGLEAVRLFEREADHIQLVLLDAVMPKMNGSEVYKHIKKIRPEISVIFCTGYNPDADQVEFAQHEGVQVVSKPFQRETLLAVIRQTLAERAESLVALR